MTALWILLVVFGIAAIAGIGYGIVRFVFWLAEVNLFWTLIEEGWAKAVGRGTAVKRIIGNWLGHIITEEGEVVDIPPEQEKEVWIWVKDNKVVPLGQRRAGAKAYKNPRHRFWGGLWWVGIYPIRQILRYRFKWTHLHEDGSIKEHEAEVLDGALLKRDLYVVELKLGEKTSAEDIDGVPIGVATVIPMRIVNVYEAIFLYKRWLALITGVVQALLRTFIARYRYKEDLLDMRAARGIKGRHIDKGISGKEDARGIKISAETGDDLIDKLWQELRTKLAETAKREKQKIKAKVGEVKIEEETIRVFGIEVQRTGFGVLTLEPDENYRRLTTARYEAERNKEIREIEAEAERTARTTETVDTLVEFFVKGTGLSRKKVKDMIAQISPDKLFDVNLDLLKREMALRGKSYYAFHFEGARPTESVFADIQERIASLIAMAKKVPPQK